MRISNLIILLVCLCAASLTAQNSNTTKAYILYKGYPYVVYLAENGEITEFVRAAPEVMNGMEFDKDQPMPIALGPYVKPVSAPLPIYVSPLNTTTVGDSEILDTEVVVADNSSNEKSDGENVVFKPKKADRSMKTTVIRREKTKTSDPVVVTNGDSKNPVAGEYILSFQGFSARLTPVLIDMLSDISKEYKVNSKNIMINSFMTAGDTANKTLAENRMAACKDLLTTYGVPVEKITTKIMPYDSSIDGNVSISFED